MPIFDPPPILSAAQMREMFPYPYATWTTATVKERYEPRWVMKMRKQVARASG